MILTRRNLLFAGAAAAMLPSLSTRASDAIRAPVELIDVPMIDARTRRRVNLISDVLRDRVVALNFIFTSCSTTCPIQSVALSEAQSLLGRKMGADVAFVSVTLDPLNDTPQALARFADAQGAGSDWHFLTGGFDSIERLRRGFDAYDPRRDDHPPVIAIGRAGAKRWSRLYGLPEPARIATEIDAWLES